MMRLVVSIYVDNIGGESSHISRISFLLAGTNAPKSPRGVPGFQLNNGTFGAWKVQGKVGGYTESAKPCSSTFLRF